MTKDIKAIVEAYQAKAVQVNPPASMNHDNRFSILATNQQPLATYRDENQEAIDSDDKAIGLLRASLITTIGTLTNIINDMPANDYKKYLHTIVERAKANLEQVDTYRKNT